MLKGVKQRVKQHKETYLNFRLINAFKVDNKLQIENAIKTHPVLVTRLRSLTLPLKKYIELIQIEGLSFNDLDKIFREIITTIEYSAINYIKILEENKALKKQISQIHEVNNTHQLILLQADNDRLQAENHKLLKKYNKTNGSTISILKPTFITTLFPTLFPTPNTPATSVVPLQTGEALTAFKKNMRNKQGTYTIAGREYQKNEGTRMEVWNEVAYQTSGLLQKADLLLNKNGKLISKKKCILAGLQNHLADYNATR